MTPAKDRPHEEDECAYPGEVDIPFDGGDAQRANDIDWSSLTSYYSLVRRASITEAKNGLSALIDRVRQGDAIVIEDRGVPVARLEPVSAPGARAAEGRAARLIRQGLLRPPSAPAPRPVLESDPPAPRRRASLSRVLLDERRGGR